MPATHIRPAPDADFPAAPWIRFLRHYGPMPQDGAQYDEHLQRLARRSQIRPLRLPTPALGAVIGALRAEPPVSVILTGTAGDGKTFHAREAWLELGGGSDDWDRPERAKTLQVGGRELVVVRDMSELKADAGPFLERLSADVCLPDASRFYLVAANDGRLLDELKRAPQTPSLVQLRQALEHALLRGAPMNANVRLRLENLAQQSAAKVLPAVIEQVTGHEAWEGCSRCPVRLPGNGVVGCPIWENRQRLRGAGDGGRLPRRLNDLLALSEHDGIHVPTRQLLLLAANALLGHPGAQHGLMQCRDVPRIQRDGTHEHASVYRNLFGENLTPRRRSQTPVFTTLRRFGIGSETTNWFDGLLVYGADDPALTEAFDALVRADTYYGAGTAYRQGQTAYLEGEDRSAQGYFLDLLRAQRQRLFFAVPEDRTEGRFLWDLTVFRYAGEYLRLIDQLRQGARVPRATVAPLVRGLNRVFTGLLATNEDGLLLATSGSHSQARTSLLLEAEVPLGPRNGAEIAVRDEGGTPALAVAVGNAAGLRPVTLSLSLLRFEFLMRVADGALPSSFSLECYEDMLALKAELIRMEERRRVAEGVTMNDGIDLQFLTISGEGRVEARPLEVRA